MKSELRANFRLMVDCIPLTVGGGVQVCVGFLNSLQASGDCEWIAVLPTKLRSALPQSLQSDRRILYLNRQSQFDRLWLNTRLRNIEKSFGPNLVFTVFGPQFFHAEAVHLVGFAMPHVLYDRDKWMPQETVLDKLKKIMRIRYFKRADFLVTETETSKNRLHEVTGIPLENINVVRNSLNSLLFNEEKSRRPKNKIYEILVPSAYYWHKRLEMIPEIAISLQRLDPHLEFVITLTLDTSSREWLDIKNLANRLGVSERVRSVGVVNVTDLANFYCSASSVLLPTVREISTAVYPEAFYYEKPLVTTDIDFAHELCGDAALFATPHSAQSYAEKLYGLTCDLELVDELVLRGKEQLKQMYPTPHAKYVEQMNLICRLASA